MLAKADCVLVRIVLDTKALPNEFGERSVASGAGSSFIRQAGRSAVINKIIQNERRR